MFDQNLPDDVNSSHASMEDSKSSPNIVHVNSALPPTPPPTDQTPKRKEKKPTLTSDSEDTNLSGNPSPNFKPKKRMTKMKKEQVT